MTIGEPQSNRSRGLAWLANRDNQTAVAGLLGWPIVTINPRSRGCLAGQSCQSTRGRGVAWLASRDNNNQPAVAGLLG